MDKKNIPFSVLPLAGSLLTLVQIGAVLTRGEAICLNEGCRIAENLTSLNQIYVNMAGLAYFQAIFWAWRLRGKPWIETAVLPAMLLAGLGAEGTMIGFQALVAHSFCSYCLTIFLLILLLNACLGFRHFFTGGLIFAAGLLVFASLRFNEGMASKGLSIDSGTCAVKTCSNPKKRLYLIFSENCPHCRAVLDNLKTCSACEVHFNPVSRLKAGTLPGLDTIKDYNPKINMILLKLLNIYTIPVLIIENRDGLSFIRGDEGIIKYLKEKCASPSTAGAELAPASPFGQQEGVCSYNEPCK